MISIKEAKQIREQLGATHIVIFAIDKDGNHVISHGESISQSKEAAEWGNKLKLALGWPLQLCKSKSLERICSHCDFWQRGYHRPGVIFLY